MTEARDWTSEDNLDERVTKQQHFFFVLTIATMNKATRFAEALRLKITKSKRNAKKSEWQVQTATKRPPSPAVSINALAASATKATDLCQDDSVSYPQGGREAIAVNSKTERHLQKKQEQRCTIFTWPEVISKVWSGLDSKSIVS